jgi:hypothetical protein
MGHRVFSLSKEICFEAAKRCHFSAETQRSNQNDVKQINFAAIPDDLMYAVNSGLRSSASAEDDKAGV